MKIVLILLLFSLINTKHIRLSKDLN